MKEDIGKKIHEFLKSPEGQEYIKESKQREEAWKMICPICVDDHSYYDPCPEIAKAKIERHDDWETPENVFTPLSHIFDFVMDAACNLQNAKARLVITEELDALKTDWLQLIRRHADEYTNQNVWLNPPYKDLTPWVQKANDEALKGCTVVMLIPNSRDTKWYHDIIVPAKKAGYCRTYSRRGRIAFVDPHPGAKRQAPKQGNMLVVFTPPMPEEWAED